EPGQQPFQECRGRPTPHHVMRRRGRGGEDERNCGENSAAKTTKAHVISHAPATRGRGCGGRRRQVSWLAGQCAPATCPERIDAPVAERGALAAYSCGGSRGFEQDLLPRSLSNPTRRSSPRAAGGNRRRTGL